jgi:hypothetical protein
MILLVTAVVAIGFGLSVAVGAGRGFDTTSVILLTLIALFGCLAIAVARKAKAGVIGPARCVECGGLLSPHAPYCKHCGVPRG